MENRLIHARPPQDSVMEPIRHRVLLRYPHLLQKAFNKYPTKVIKNHLQSIHFAGEIDVDGFKYSGSYDPFRQLIFLVDNGSKNNRRAMRTFHHEFSSLLIKSRSFFVNPWTDHHPKSFKYMREVHESHAEIKKQEKP